VNWWHWIVIHLSQETGTSNSSSRAYDFWSGAGSDLGELTLVGALIAMVRSRNCEVHKCWRLGRHTTAAGHRSCRRHHPDGHLSEAQLHRAHHEARR
jgi:hypothetical protein